MTIIQLIVRRRDALVRAALVLMATALVACEAKPFSVLAPGFGPRVGSALVSVTVPPFSRGLIREVTVRVTSAPADTSRMRAISRNMNFPSPGGNLSTGQISAIPIGLRRFTVRAFDTNNALRFQGFADSTVSTDRTQLVQVTFNRVGGSVDFLSAIDSGLLDTLVIDSLGVASLPPTSVLDVIELVSDPHHPSFGVLPVFSVTLGDRFSMDDTGRFTRLVTADQVPTGLRIFAAHLKDLSSNESIAFADTIVVEVDTLRTAKAAFDMRLVQDAQTLSTIFTQALPADSTIVVTIPQF